MKNKTQFETRCIRDLTNTEILSLRQIKRIIKGDIDIGVIGKIPGFVSIDKQDRSLLFSSIIAEKITNHGDIIPENMAININDWDIVLMNIRSFKNGVIQNPNPDKINLIKLIPDSNNYLLTGADRQNGYFILTHYEVAVKTNELKSLLGRGDSFTPDGTPLGPKDFPYTPPAKAVSGRFKDV